MKALVTGGAGFIGSYLVDALLGENWEVAVLDNLEPRVHPTGRPQFLNSGAHFIQGDVRNHGDWIRALDGVGAVFHQAAYQDYMPDYSKFFHSNVVGTSLLYEVIRERKLPVWKIVVASSQSVYGEGQYQCDIHGLVLPRARSEDQMMRAEWDPRCAHCRRPLKVKPLEEQYTNPYNPYALSKYSQELVALRLGKLLDIPTVALRYSITQGPRQSPYNAYSGICRIFTSRLLNNEAPIVYEDGHQLRDYVHVSDVVRANLLVLKDARANFEAFNVGSGVGTTVLEYARLLSETLGTEIRPVVPGKFRFGDNRNSVSSIEKLRALGWSLQKNLLDILKDYIDWRRSFVLEEQSYLQADEDMEKSGVVGTASGKLS